MDAQGCPPSAPGVIWGSSWGSPGTLLSAPGLLRGNFWSAWGCDLARFWIVLESPARIRGENGDKLEFDDTLNGFALFSTSQRLQNEALTVPKRAERREKSRENATRVQRGDKSALRRVSGALWELEFRTEDLGFRTKELTPRSSGLKAKDSRRHQHKETRNRRPGGMCGALYIITIPC